MAPPTAIELRLSAIAASLDKVADAAKVYQQSVSEARSEARAAADLEDYRAHDDTEPLPPPEAPQELIDLLFSLRQALPALVEAWEPRGFEVGLEQVMNIEIWLSHEVGMTSECLEYVQV